MTEGEFRLLSKLFNSLKQEVSIRLDNDDLVKRLAVNLTVDECNKILESYKNGFFDQSDIEKIMEE